MRAFSASMREGFEERLVEHVERAWPEEIWNVPEPVVRQRLHRTVDRALAYNVKRERDVVIFVDLTYEHGESFELVPGFAWARRILEDPGLAGAEKIARILALLEAARERAER